MTDRVPHAGRTRALRVIALLILVACDGIDGSPSTPLQSEGSLLEVVRSSLDGSSGTWAISGDPASPAPGDPTVLSVTLAARSVGTTVLGFDVLQVPAAAGRVLVSGDDPEFSANRMLRGRGTVVGVIPAATASLPLSADYWVSAREVSGDARVPVELSVWVKRALVAGRVPATQDLPITLVKVGRVQSSEAAITSVLSTVRVLWRAAGIELRETARVVLDPDAPSTLAIDPRLGSDTTALGVLLARSAQVAGEGLCVFLVEDVVLQTGAGSVWAVAGGIPVPPERGTPRSGLAVSAALVDADARLAGQVIAHELGHALGLFHTTEGPLRDRGGGPTAVHDQLDDTPECPSANDRAPADGSLSSAECTDHDARNLMFWAPTRGASALTPMQSDVVRRSALTR